MDDPWLVIDRHFPKSGHRVAYQFILLTRENEGMTCQVPSRIVSFVSKLRAPKIRSPIRCKCSSNIIVNTKPLLSYNLLLDPSLPINQSICLSISIRTQAGPGSERRLFLCLHQVPILAQTQQVSLQHGDRHLPDRGYVDRGLPRSIVQGGSVSTARLQQTQ